ncbi:MAG TPA: diguanylate cyclase [Acidimicrobiales bacterium]
MARSTALGLAVALGGLACGVAAAVTGEPALSVASGIAALAVGGWAIRLTADVERLRRDARATAGGNRVAPPRPARSPSPLTPAASDDLVAVEPHDSTVARAGVDEPAVERERLALRGTGAPIPSHHPSQWRDQDGPQRRRTDPLPPRRRIPPPTPESEPASPAAAVAVPRRGALTDDHTGLKTAVYFAPALEDRIAMARRALRPVTVAMCAVDGVGGPDLIELADSLGQALRDVLRECDTACRLSHDQFALILDDTPDTSAVWAIERLRRVMAGNDVVGLRAGIASYPTHGLTAEEVSDRARRALELATQQGRGGIQVARID